MQVESSAAPLEVITPASALVSPLVALEKAEQVKK